MKFIKTNKNVINILSIIFVAIFILVASSCKQDDIEKKQPSIENNFWPNCEYSYNLPEVNFGSKKEIYYDSEKLSAYIECEYEEANSYSKELFKSLTHIIDSKIGKELIIIDGYINDNSVTFNYENELMTIVVKRIA